MNELIKINSCILTLDEKSFTKLLLYGDDWYESKIYESVILASIKFIYSSKRFDGQLMWWRKQHICLRCLDFSFCHIISAKHIMRSCLKVSMYYNFLSFLLWLTVLFASTFVTYILLKPLLKRIFKWKTKFKIADNAQISDGAIYQKPVEWQR